MPSGYVVDVTFQYQIINQFFVIFQEIKNFRTVDCPSAKLPDKAMPPPSISRGRLTRNRGNKSYRPWPGINIRADNNKRSPVIRVDHNKMINNVVNVYFAVSHYFLH